MTLFWQIWFIGWGVCLFIVFPLIFAFSKKEVKPPSRPISKPRKLFPWIEGFESDEDYESDYCKVTGKAYSKTANKWH